MAITHIVAVVVAYWNCEHYGKGLSLKQLCVDITGHLENRFELMKLFQPIIRSLNTLPLHTVS